MKELEKPGKADDAQAEGSMTAAPEGEKAVPSEETLRAEIEAILFSLGESVDIAVIAEAVGLSLQNGVSV